MSQLHQMQITFVPEEDRLLFRLNTQGRHREEFRFWLTRRYVRLLWNALINMLKTRQTKEFVHEDTKTVALSVKHQEAVSQADFKTAYQESYVFPLGESPILLSKIAIKAAPEQNAQVISLLPTQGPGLDFNLNDNMLHSFCKLLADSAAKAEWDLDLDFGQAEDLLAKRRLN